MSRTALAEADRLADQDVEHIVQSAWAMCQTQHEMLKQSLERALAVANTVLQESGAVGFEERLESWKAVNQFDKAAAEVSLPRMTVGGRWLGKVADAGTPAAIVDRVTLLHGAACTVFQRMNEAGDLLRVCTNVKTKDGKRAIGTFIPAKQPDGAANPVVTKLLAGERYEGKAMVVGEWYLSAYEPLKDAAGKVVGALFVGVPQRSATALRKALADTKVGESGYVFVVQGKGDQRGNYVLSQGGQRDGENVWEAADSQGGKPIQTLVTKAVELTPGATVRHRYLWKGADQRERWQVTRVSYFEPWDWVIGAAAYEDEMQASSRRIAATGSRVTGLTIGVLAFAVVVAVLVWLVVAGRLSTHIGDVAAVLDRASRQVASGSTQVAAASTEMADGAGRQSVALQDTNAHVSRVGGSATANADSAAEAKRITAGAEGTMASARTAMQELGEVMGRIKVSSDETQKINGTINAISFQTNLLALNAAVEAARAGEAGQGFAVVAAEVRELAKRSAEAARQTSDLLAEVQRNADEGVGTSQQVAELLATIGDAVREASARIAAVSAASAEQTSDLSAVLRAVGEADQATQATAAAAEESAAASEELSSQAAELEAMVSDLMNLVHGATAAPAAVAATAVALPSVTDHRQPMATF